MYCWRIGYCTKTFCLVKLFKLSLLLYHYYYFSSTKYWWIKMIILRYTRVRTRRCAAYSGATRTWSRRRCLHRRHTSRHRCSQLLSNATTISSSSSSQRYVPWTAYQTTTWCSPDTLLTVSQSTVLNIIIFNIIAGVINGNESAITYRFRLTVVYKLHTWTVTPKYVFKYL